MNNDISSRVTAASEALSAALKAASTPHHDREQFDREEYRRQFWACKSNEDCNAFMKNDALKKAERIRATLAGPIPDPAKRRALEIALENEERYASQF